MGALHVPRYPERHGAERFSGPAFHSSTWDHHVDLAGKNVAVVGTGASAVQFVPQIAPRVGRLNWAASAFSFSDDFYPTLKRTNVELVTEAIAEIREGSVVTDDRVERPVDVLIYGTGFRAREPLIGCASWKSVRKFSSRLSKKSTAACPAPSGNPAAATVGIKTSGPAKSLLSGPAPSSPTSAAGAPYLLQTTN